MIIGDSKDCRLWRCIWEDFQYHKRGGKFRWWGCSTGDKWLLWLYFI